MNVSENRKKSEYKECSLQSALLVLEERYEEGK